ncbi:MAG: response regulator [Candidatus Omnitrophica bacterium]|nr:response regulator [Candidatus Omnitrophota bacterium]
MAKTILIIDDEIDVMKMVVYRLKARNFNVLTAADGSTGVLIAYRNTLDLVFLDYRLPDMEAEDVTKAIRDNDATRNVPIILVTASVEDIFAKSGKCGTSDFLAKPIDPDELYRKVEKYLK